MPDINRTFTPRIERVGDADAGYGVDGLNGEKVTLAAFPALYHRYLSPVYRYVWFRIGDRSDAEDLTSQIFLAALEGLPRYRTWPSPGGSFAAWLFTIARHKIADHFRKRQVQVSLDEDIQNFVEDGDLLSVVINKDDLVRLANLISALREDEQELLNLRFAAELSFDEIATVLKKRPSAVKMQLYRLLRQVEQNMNR